MDWIEIRYKTGQLDKPGPRYCGCDAPNRPIETIGNEMLVLFYSKGTQTQNGISSGFSANIESKKIFLIIIFIIWPIIN